MNDADLLVTKAQRVLSGFLTEREILKWIHQHVGHSGRDDLQDLVEMSDIFTLGATTDGDAWLDTGLEAAAHRDYVCAPAPAARPGPKRLAKSVLTSAPTPRARDCNNREDLPSLTVEHPPHKLVQMLAREHATFGNSGCFEVRRGNGKGLPIYVTNE